MDEHSLQVLEFPKLKQLLAGYAISVLGREAIDSIQVLKSVEEIKHTQRDVSAMVRLLEVGQRLPSEGWHDIRVPLKRSYVTGAELEAQEIIYIGEFAAAVRRVQGFLKRNRDTSAGLVIYAQQLISHEPLEDAIAQIFDEHGQIKDTASRELSKLRKSLRQNRERLVHRLEKMMRSKYNDYLQEHYYTLREGRYVLPVDAKYQNQINGIVHGRSTTGNTVFIEPIEIVQDGNHLKDMQREEEIECRRILREVTAKIGEVHLEITNNIHIMQRLDLLFAKAQFADTYRMKAPAISEGQPLKLIDLKHPLLLLKEGHQNVVANTIEFLPQQKGMIITGPNTGGKTVILKTVGLLVAMAQCGMHIPADGNSSIPVFHHIGADIGDEQSLEQSLSTFSSHIGNIKSLLAVANERTLILLDELGTGTDPLEGGPLAVSILEAFLQKGSSFFATTHLHDLKLFAYDNPQVENAALEFDLQNLKPTYRFQMGLPGQSNALQIAQQLGLPIEIVNRAHSKIDSKGSTPEELLQQLGEELRDAQAKHQLAASELEAAQAMQEDSERRLENAKREAKELTARYEKKAQGLLQELERRLKSMEKQQRQYERQWEERLKKLVENTKPTEKPTSVIEKLKDEINSLKQRRLWHEDDSQFKKHKRQKWRWEELKPKSRVRVDGFSDLGEVRSVNQDRGIIEITINTLNLRLSATQVAAVFPAMTAPEQLYQSSYSIDRPEYSDHEIDIHGMTVEEMTPVVEKYVDEAFRSGRPSIRIIHGHGTGRLRRAVRRIVSEIPTVLKFRNGMDFEGGTGVTVVEFQSR